MYKIYKVVVILAFLTAFSTGPALARVRHKRPRVMVMRATAFARAAENTAAGTEAREGIVAADPAVLPLGTRIRISGTEAYDGYYLVTDTGARVKGRHIDLYVPSRREAKEFGTKRVRVQVLEVGEGKADAREKDESASLRRRR